LLSDLQVYIDDLEKDRLRLKVQLDACLSAAKGRSKGVRPGTDQHSDVFEAVRELYDSYAQILEQLRAVVFEGGITFESVRRQDTDRGTRYVVRPGPWVATELQDARVVIDGKKWRVKGAERSGAGEMELTVLPVVDPGADKIEGDVLLKALLESMYDFVVFLSGRVPGNAEGDALMERMIEAMERYK
jgi:hypothetical protein